MSVDRILIPEVLAVLRGQGGGVHRCWKRSNDLRTRSRSRPERGTLRAKRSRCRTRVRTRAKRSRCRTCNCCVIFVFLQLQTAEGTPQACSGTSRVALRTRAGRRCHVNGIGHDAHARLGGNVTVVVTLTIVLVLVQPRARLYHHHRPRVRAAELRVRRRWQSEDVFESGCA